MAEILFDDTYTGPRWRYGLNYRPVGYANVPAGWIVQSDRAAEHFAHGTVDYPRRLTQQEIDGYELTNLGKVPEHMEEIIEEQHTLEHPRREHVNGSLVLIGNDAIGSEPDAWKWKTPGVPYAMWSPPFDTFGEALADARATISEEALA